jgi:hypothetical protein
MKIELDADEVWVLFSTVAREALDGTELADEDRAALRRWRSQQMRPGGESMRTLVQKVNEDLDRLGKVRERSALTKHDWV